MEKKKNYVQPESTCVELEVRNTICAISSGTDPGDDEPGSGAEVTPTDNNIWDSYKQ